MSDPLCNDSRMKNPSFRKRNRNRNRTILCLLSAISYLLIISSAFAWDDENWGACQNKNNERLYELKREREQRLDDFVGGWWQLPVDERWFDDRWSYDHVRWGVNHRWH